MADAATTISRRSWQAHVARLPVSQEGSARGDFPLHPQKCQGGRKLQVSAHSTVTGGVLAMSVPSAL